LILEVIDRSDPRDPIDGRNGQLIQTELSESRGIHGSKRNELITDLEELFRAPGGLDDLTESRGKVGDDTGELTEIEGVLTLTKGRACQWGLSERVRGDRSDSLTESVEAWKTGWNLNW
jgi:hypothetical protein